MDVAVRVMRVGPDDIEGMWVNLAFIQSFNTDIPCIFKKSQLTDWLICVEPRTLFEPFWGKMEKSYRGSTWEKLDLASQEKISYFWL